MNQPPKPGTLVHSLAGRDAGEHYLVVGILGPNTVLVANGLNRPLKSPKKKNLRHLRLHSVAPVETSERISRRKARDEEIARAIRDMVGVDRSGGEREGNEPDVNKEEGRY
jgi:ribosomal protein L14E/L6E/L27E